MGGGNLSENFLPINFTEFKWLVKAGELDGIIIADKAHSNFTKQVVKICQFNSIEKIGIVDPINLNFFNAVYMLEPGKIYVGYLEANIVDGCNLNCRGCTHFSGLFSREEIYPLENFYNDVHRLSKICDIVRFRLLGGEPLLSKNLDEYIRIVRKNFPKTNLKIVTNGLLIPSLPQKILNSIRENKCMVDISPYAPTFKILDRIKNILISNGITFQISTCALEHFLVFLSLQAGHNPQKARAVCINDLCRFLRNGKIYKCPIDALSYRYTERFGIENYPTATGVDIYAPNFAALLEMLNENVEMCSWCSEKARMINWEPSNNPRIEDWLADPEEIKNFS